MEWIYLILKLAVIAVIVLNWDWIMENIIVNIFKFVVSIFSLGSLLLMIGAPVCLVLYCIFGRKLHALFSNPSSVSVLTYIIFGIIAIALLALLVLFIVASFSDEGRMGYLKGVKRNMQSRQSSSSRSSSSSSSSQSPTTGYGSCPYYRTDGGCELSDDWIKAHSCPCGGDRYSNSCPH